MQPTPQELAAVTEELRRIRRRLRRRARAARRGDLQRNDSAAPVFVVLTLICFGGFLLYYYDPQ